MNIIQATIVFLPKSIRPFFGVRDTISTNTNCNALLTLSQACFDSLQVDFYSVQKGMDIKGDS